MKDNEIDVSGKLTESSIKIKRTSSYYFTIDDNSILSFDTKTALKLKEELQEVKKLIDKNYESVLNKDYYKNYPKSPLRYISEFFNSIKETEQS